MNFDFQPTPIGWSHRSPRLTVFFGNRNAELSRLQQTYPHFVFRRVKQVHGDQIVENRASSVDFDQVADAHFTQELGLGVCSITADCVPVLVAHRYKNWIMAIHAGWRGVAQRIVPKCFDRMIAEGLQPHDCDIFIGPHIGKDSFEVRADALTELERASLLSSNSFSVTRGPEHFLVDLYRIVCSQIAEYAVPLPQIHSLDLDTYGDKSLHSYRRDGKESGRQISFIALHSPGEE